MWQYRDALIAGPIPGEPAFTGQPRIGLYFLAELDGLDREVRTKQPAQSPSLTCSRYGGSIQTTRFAFVLIRASYGAQNHLAAWRFHEIDATARRATDPKRHHTHPNSAQTTPKPAVVHTLTSALGATPLALRRYPAGAAPGSPPGSANPHLFRQP